jgi:hypothetical protein
MHREKRLVRGDGGDKTGIARPWFPRSKFWDFLNSPGSFENALPCYKRTLCISLINRRERGKPPFKRLRPMVHG